MAKDFLDERRKALEDSFFAKQNEKLLESLRRSRADDEKRAELSRVSGILDEKVLDELVRLQIGPETLAALSLVPLVTVAWADGLMEARERKAVLEGAVYEAITELYNEYVEIED